MVVFVWLEGHQEIVLTRCKRGEERCFRLRITGIDLLRVIYTNPLAVITIYAISASGMQTWVI